MVLFRKQLFYQWRVALMDIKVSDKLVMKKKHPCGSAEWKVLRVGMDFKLECQGCGHEIMVPRNKIEKNIKQILRSDDSVN